MSSFAIAMPVVHEHEGHSKFTNSPGDAGGPTKWGMSLRFMAGLPLSLGDIDGDGDIDIDDVRALTKEAAEHIYRVKWWERYGYGEIASQTLATKIFDLAVNMGGRRAHLIVQRSLRGVGVTVADDGIIGPRSRTAINGVVTVEYLPALREGAAGFYRSIAKGDNRQWLNGWLNRAYY